LVNREEQFLIEGLCEHPALSKQGPEICLQQIADGLKIATDLAGVALVDVVAIGLDTPGPASAAGQLSAEVRPTLGILNGRDSICARVWRTSSACPCPT
jgi:hypothetical protein